MNGSGKAQRIAVVGLGNAGLNLHLAALKGIEAAQVVGACDPDSKRREKAQSVYGIQVFEDFETLIGKTKPDVVIIATPPESHASYCLRSLASGAHVICEKPFVSSVDEAEEVIEAARSAGKFVALNHEFREMPIFRAVLDATKANGDKGSGVVFAQAWQLMDLPPWAEPGWRGNMLERTLYEAGVHLVDFLLALFGELPVSVQASTSTCGVREGKTDAVALATLEFSRGRLAQVVQDRLCKGETQYFEVRADTIDASYRASFGGRMRLSAGLLRSTKPHVRFDYGLSGIAWKESGNKRTVLAGNPKDPAMVGTRLVLEKTLRAFREGLKPPASGEDGRDVLKVIAACYHSASQGKRVLLSSEETRSLSSMQMGKKHPS